VLTLAISYHSSLLERVHQKIDGITKDILKNVSKVLGIRSPQSAVTVKIEHED